MRAIRVAWVEANAEEKRTIVGQLAHAMRLAIGKPVAVEWRTPEELAATASA